MADARWLPVIGVVALMLVVPTLLCVGLSGDDDDDTTRRPSEREHRSRRSDGPVDEGHAVDTAPEPAFDDQGGAGPLPLPEGERRLRGVVRDRARVAIAGAEVLSEATDSYDETDEEGRYLLNSQPAAELVLVVSALGYRDERVVVPSGEDDTEDRADVTLEPGTAPAGSVVDPQGRTVRGAKVRCEDDDDGMDTETDHHGRFALTEPAIGCPAKARHPDFAPSAPVTLEAGPGNRLALTEPGSIVGTVVDAEGRAITTFIVSVASFTDTQGRPQPMRYRQTFSHPQGRFTIGRLEGGTYELEIGQRRAMGKGATVKTKPVLVAPGEGPARLRVAFE